MDASSALTKPTNTDRGMNRSQHAGRPPPRDVAPVVEVLLAVGTGECLLLEAFTNATTPSSKHGVEHEPPTAEQQRLAEGPREGAAPLSYQVVPVSSA